MGAKFKTMISSDMPESHVETVFDMGNDPIHAVIYTNLAYDLYAAATAKLGWEFSKFVMGQQDQEAVAKSMSDAIKSLSIEG
jgi:hypothetical protein